MRVELKRVDLGDDLDTDANTGEKVNLGIISFAERVEEFESQARFDFFELVSKLSPRQIQDMISGLTDHDIYKQFGITRADMDIIINIHTNSWFRNCEYGSASQTPGKVVKLFPEA